MAEKQNKIVLTIKQKLKLTKKFGNSELATKLAKEYVMGMKILT
jgi:hypothetical protein